MSIAIPPGSDRDRNEHERAWLEHVRAGRIGQRPEPSPELLLIHLHNEEVLLGRSVSVRLGSVRRGRW